jgi:trk system potassium uptake protein
VTVKSQRGRRGGKAQRAARAERDATATEQDLARPAPRPVESVFDSFTPELGRPPLRATLEWLLLGYFAVLVFGFVMLRFSMSSGNEFNVDRAIFTAVDAGTLSGFQLNVGSSQFKPGNLLGPAALLLLTLGGSFFTLAIGSVLGVRILRLRYTDGQVMNWALGAIAVATLGGTVVLLGNGRSPYDAFLLAAAAFGNSGVHTGPVPGVADASTHLVLLPLAFVGSLGLPVLMEIYDRIFGGRPLSGYSRRVLLLAAGFYVVGTLLLLLVRESVWETLIGGITGSPAPGALSLRQAMLSSAAESVNARTLGQPLEYAGWLPRTAQWVLLALMAVGAAPAGTGGGIKTTTIAQLVRGVRDVLAGRAVPRAFGIAAAWVGAYGLIVAAGLIALLIQVPQMPADQLLFLSVSATSNVGLSHDALSLVTWPLGTLSILMLLGRAVPFLILWWMAETTDGAETLVA